MKIVIALMTVLSLLASPALAKDYTVKSVSNENSEIPYYYSPAKLTINPGDTVHFINAQDDPHDVIFTSIPKGAEEAIKSPMLMKAGDKFSYIFTIPGTYEFHCHPHEALGMKGTLIVGQESKAGETVDIGHHH